VTIVRNGTEECFSTLSIKQKRRTEEKERTFVSHDISQQLEMPWVH
jgi:hypothetical protein